MEIDLRQIAFATLWKKYEKKINNDAMKTEIRNGKATYKFADYCKVATKDYTTNKYSAEDQAKIDQFIKDNDIKKISETKENYAIEFIPSEKAIKEFNKMLDKLADTRSEDLINTIKYAQIAIEDYKRALYKGGDITTAITHAEYYINNLYIELDKFNKSQHKNIAKVASKVKSII